jgi:hypothetical protein
MRKAEYIEGPEALENFRQLGRMILQTPVEKKKKQAKKPASRNNEPKSDQD